MIMAGLYIGSVLTVFVLIWIRHYHLIVFRFGRYMSDRHPAVWKAMIEDAGWYRPQWATLYYSKAVYDFIWRSEEDFGEKDIAELKKKIRAIIWELPLYFVAVAVITSLLIWSGILQ